MIAVFFLSSWVRKKLTHSDIIIASSIALSLQRSEIIPACQSTRRSFTHASHTVTSSGVTRVKNAPTRNKLCIRVVQVAYQFSLLVFL
jgi:hypothetical protein